jgi:hypothetical protein
MFFLLDMSALNPYADAVLQGNNCEYFGAFIDEFGTAQDIALGIPLSSFLHGMEFSPSSPSPGKASGVFYAITPKRTDNSHHIFISNGEGFFTFNVNENGIEEIAYNTFGSSEFNPYNLRGEMEVSVLKNGNYRIAVPYVPGQMGMGTNVINEYIYTAEVDSTGFAIDSTILRLPLYASLNTSGNNQMALTRGLEFSEGGEFLYVTHTTTTQQPAAFEYYNFATGNDTLVPVPGQNISDFQYSMIEMAFDQKLMLANENGLYALDNATDPTSGISLFSSFDYEPNAEGEALPSSLKSYMLQDQIDGTDYLAPFTGDVTCCIESSTYDVDLFVASISESWTPSSNPLNNGSGDEVYIRQEIKIPAGKTITIKNMELHFAPGARLVVENGIGITGIGGKLILDSTTLTADARCDKSAMWLGVEVWGNQSLAQGANQGYFELQNYSVIEDAMIGILVSARPTLYDPNDQGCGLNPVYPTTNFMNQRNGGIVKAIVGKSTLRNNKQGVYFRKYFGGTASSGANNQSIFDQVSFVWDDLVKTEPNNHVRLVEVKGVIFRGCYFGNQISEGLAYYQTGNGIISKDAQFHVYALCTSQIGLGQSCPPASWERSKFVDLDFGIISVNNNGLSMSCMDANFYRNRHGIHLNGTQNERILSNFFHVRKSDAYQTSGLSLYRSSGYHVENNDFIGDPGSSIAEADALSYGVVVNNSGIAKNEIYRNRFNDLRIGGQTEGINAFDINAQNNPSTDSFKMSGLIWTCNDFQSEIFSNDMTLFYNYGEGRMNYHQGYATGGSSLLDQALKAARNKFSLIGETNQHDFFFGNNTQEVQYCHLNANRHIPDSYTSLNMNNFVMQSPFSLIPAQFGGDVINNDDNTCPSKLISKQNPKLLMKQISDQIGFLDSLKDGGNTQNLLDLISNGTQEAIQSGLSSASPYLSDTVLLSFIASSPNSSDLVNIVLANSPVSEIVGQAVDSLMLSSSVQSQIDSAQSGISQRTLLNFEINYLNDQFQELYQSRIREALLDDDSTADLTNLISVLKEENDRERLEQLLKVLATINDTVQYDDSRIDYVGLDNHCPYFLEYADIRKLISQDSSTYEAIQNDPGISSELIALKNYSPNKAVANDAKCLLELNEILLEIPFFVTELANSAYNQNDSNSQANSNSKQPNGLIIFPNPSTGKVSIQFDQDVDGVLSIQVYSLDGKQMALFSDLAATTKQIDLSHLKRGVYFIHIQRNDEPFAPVMWEKF